MDISVAGASAVAEIENLLNLIPADFPFFFYIFFGMD